MNGVVVRSQAPLGFAREADAVTVGSGVGTRAVVSNSALMSQLKLELVLAKLGLLGGVPACTDSKTKPWVHYVAPVGEKQAYVERAAAAVRRYLPAARELA
jgi:hypothetical protein